MLRLPPRHPSRPHHCPQRQSLDGRLAHHQDQHWMWRLCPLSPCSHLTRWCRWSSSSWSQRSLCPQHCPFGPRGSWSPIGRQYHSCPLSEEGSCCSRSWFLLSRRLPRWSHLPRCWPPSLRRLRSKRGSTRLCPMFDRCFSIRYSPEGLGSGQGSCSGAWMGCSLPTLACFPTVALRAKKPSTNRQARLIAVKHAGWGSRTLVPLQHRACR